MKLLPAVLILFFGIGVGAATTASAQSKTDIAAKSAAAQKSPKGSGESPAVTDAERIKVLTLQKKQSDLESQENQAAAQYEAAQLQASQAQQKASLIESEKQQTLKDLQAAQAEIGKRIGDKFDIDWNTFTVTPAPPAKPLEKK